MPEAQVDAMVRVRAEGEDLLRRVNEEFRKTGHISQEVRKELKDYRQDIVQQNRALSTLRLAYREQYQELELAGRAFSSVGSAVRNVMNMYTQWNVAMIRQNQLQEAVTVAQEKYTAAVERYGPASLQATTAAHALSDAQERLVQAQQQNTLMFVGFAAQFPALITNLKEAVINFQLLAKVMRNAQISGADLAVGVGSLAAALAALYIYNVLLTKKQEEFHQKAGLTEEDFRRLSDLANRLGLSVDIVTEAVKNGAITTDRYGKSLDDIRQKLQGVGETTEGAISSAVDMAREIIGAKTKVDALTDSYSSGQISMEEYAKGLLEVGMSADDAAKKISSVAITIPVLKTWQEALVDGMSDAIDGLNAVISGKMPGTVAEMQAAMDTLAAGVNQSIETKLLGQAQRGMEAFRNCVTGKMYDLPDQGKKAIGDLVADTNESIKKGWLGEAQKNIQAFANCSDSKVADMARFIEGEIVKLTGEIEKNDQLILQNKRKHNDDIVRVLEEENERKKARRQQYADWEKDILTPKAPVSIYGDVEDWLKMPGEYWWRAQKPPGLEAQPPGIGGQYMWGQGLPQGIGDQTGLGGLASQMRTAYEGAYPFYTLMSQIAMKLAEANVQTGLWVTSLTLVNEAVTAFNELSEDYTRVLVAIANNLTGIRNAAVAAKELVEGLAKAVLALPPYTQVVIDVIINVSYAFGGFAMPEIPSIPAMPGGGVWSFQRGTPYVPRTGLYMLHRGEEVTPANKVSDTPQASTVNVNITIERFYGSEIEKWEAELTRRAGRAFAEQVAERRVG